MNRIKIAVMSRTSDLKPYHKQLKKFRLINEDRQYKKYSGTYSRQKDIDRIHLFCSRNHLKFFYDNQYGNGHRSSNYRRKYFSTHPPDAGKNRYYCVYCGRKMTKEQVTVDHLYPLNKAAQDLLVQKAMFKAGITSSNCEKNLVAACAKCNRSKSDKMGSWIRRGTRGSRPGYWKTRHAAKWLFIIMIIVITFTVSTYLFPDTWQQIISAISTYI